jgi:hypothetical protein
LTKEQLTTIIYETFHKYIATIGHGMQDFRLVHNIEITEDLQDDFANAESILLHMEDKDKMYEHLNVFTKKEILTFIALTGCYTMLISVVYTTIRSLPQIDDIEKDHMLSTIMSFVSTSEEFRNTLLPFMEGDLL